MGYSEQPSSRKSSREVGGGEERWKAPDHPQVSSLKIEVEMSRIVLSLVWSSKLRLTASVTQPFCHDEFRVPRSGLCRSGGISNNNINLHHALKQR
ncbi:hypothetical protein TNCV_4397551 [Trichonephila clavipes]|nr:hypothetical protein TNCV_4397551 [Trichonephila clavipes]